MILDFRFLVSEIANRKSQIKNGLRLVSCILCLASFIAWDVFAQNWYSVEVDPGSWKGVDLNDVYFVGNQGWAVGDNGTIIHTYTGARWHDQVSGVDTIDLNGVHFEDTREGWVIGQDGIILHTLDGGITWQRRKTGDEDLNGVYFTDKKRGWAVGARGTILRTDDGGNTWVNESIGLSGDLHGVYFYNANSGWAVGEDGAILHWDGNKWEQGSYPGGDPKDLYGVHFTNSTDGWIVGDQGVILHTSDGSIWALWEVITSSDLRSVYFPEEQYGWIMGEHGTILHTNNYGAQWFTQSGPVNRELNAIYALSVNEVWAVGDNGSIIQWTGQSWNIFENPPYDNFWDVSFGSNSDGWIVGDEGVILRTEDGGKNWDEDPSPTDKTLYGVHFLDQYNGWAVGEAGIILKTADGATWKLEEEGGSPLRGVHFADLNNGWAVGDSGTILHWDGGAWRLQASPITADLYGVYFMDDNEGWVVGDSGSVLYTNDGGLKWVAMEIPTEVGRPGMPVPRLRGVYFADDNNGWIVGDGGVILYKHENGRTQGSPLREQKAGTTSDLYDVDFVSSVEGWIAGAGRVTLSTRNAGNRWDLHITPTGGDLYGIEFTDWGTGIAVGESGTVIRYVSTVPSVKIKLILPYGNVTTFTPTFKWESSRPDLEHTIFIDDDSDLFHNPMRAITVSDTTSYTLDEPLKHGMYYWGIEMRDGTRSDPGYLQFTAWPPTEVTLISPSGYIPEASPTFQWDCNNQGLADLGLITYTLFIDDDDTPYDGISIFANGNLSHKLSSSDPWPSLSEGQYSWGVRTSGIDSVESGVFDFTVDLSPPTGTIEINGGDEFTNSPIVTLTLSASDPLATGDEGSGVTEMRFSNDGLTWSDPEALAETKTWDLSQYGGNSQDGEKRVHVQYKDDLGHWMTTPASDDITLDTVPPTGTISINDGAEVTGSTDVILSLSASDDRSGVEAGGQMMLSNDGNTWPGVPLGYETSRNWDLLVYGGNGEEGIKRVYVKYRDAAGNWMTQPASDDIRLDLTGPTGTIVINGGAELTNSLLVTLTLSAEDESGVQFMQFTNGSDNWSLREPYSTKRENWDLSQYGGNSEDGEKTVYVRFVDSVGNVTVPAAADDITLKSEVSVSVQIFSPRVEGKVKNNDVVQVDGSSESNLIEVTPDVLDESGKPLDLDLTGVIYEPETGRIAGSFNVAELTAKTVQLKLTVKDDLGNQADAASNILNVDNEPPGNIAVSIDQGELINSTSIDLTISATDALEMYVDGDVEDLIPTEVGPPRAWIPYASTLKIRLTDGDGTKEVRVKFRDDMENESAVDATQRVATTLDTTPPTGTIIINDGDEFARTFLVTLTLSAADDNGIEGYRLSNDGNIWSDELRVTGDGLRVDEWDLRQYGGDSSEEARSVYVKYKDKAGNFSRPISDDIHVDATAPTISVQLVTNDQEAMEPITVTAIIKDNRTITETSLHYRRKGPREYTTVSMAKLPGDYYTAEIPGTEVTLAGVEYYVSASDGLWTATHPPKDAPIAPNSFTVVDTTRPSIEHDPVGEVPVKSSPDITARVTDAVEVEQVSLFYKLSSDRRFLKVDMTADTVPDEYSASIPALDQLGDVDYYIEAVDSSSNSRTSPAKGAIQPYRISFVDIEPPVIVHTGIPDGQEAGRPVLIGATITDNMVVQKALLKYKVVGKRESIEVEMVSIGAYYSAEIPGTIVMPGSIDYSITASDGSPQSEDSEVSHSFTVVDTTPPDIELTFVPSQVEVHKDISIEAKVTDNVKVKDVILYYEGVGDANWSTVAMAGVGDRYSATIPAQERAGEVKFYVYAEDSHGVSSTEPAVDPQNAPRVITIIDVSSPVIEHSPVVGVQEAGQPVTITATVTDDVQVADVSLHYRTAGQEGFKLTSMVETSSSGDPAGRIYSGSIPESAVILSGVEYYIKAMDDSFNVATHPAVSPDTLPHSFRVADTVPPDIVYDPSKLETALITEDVVVMVEATDLTGIKEVRVFYRREDETGFISQICKDMGADKFSATLPPPPSKGRIYYYIQGEDNSGNKSTSPKENPTAQPHSVFIDDPFPPLPPTRLTANSAPGGVIILTWEFSTSLDTDKYNIYTDSGSGTMDYTQVYDSVDSSTDTWESPQLVEAGFQTVTYRFVVRAVDRSGNVEDNTTSVSAEADATKPEPATDLVAENRPGGRVQIKWSLSVSKDAYVYNIYWDDAQVGIDYSSPLARVNDPLHSWTSEGLRDGVVYRFVVRCADRSGNEEENADFVSAKADATPPGNVTGLFSPTHKVAVWSNQAQVTVKWSPAEDTGTGLAGYSVSWNTSERTLPDEVMDIGNEITVDGTLSGNQYFHIRPVDKAGNWRSEASHLGPFLIDTQPPQPPINLEASSQAGGKVRLDWEISRSADVVRYNIYWDNGTGRGIDYSKPVGTLQWRMQTATSVLAWTSPALEDGRTYQFSVRAEDRAGNEEKNIQKSSSVADSQPPSIIHKPIVGLLEQEIVSAPIEATVTDASGLDRVELHYRKRGETGYTDVEMVIEQAASLFTGEIPSSAFSSAGVDYYISASDKAGNVSKYPVLTIAVGANLVFTLDGPGENEILMGDGLSLHFPAGAVATDTHLNVTVPRSIPEPQTGLGKHILTREFGLDAELNKSIKLTLRYSDGKAVGEDESKLAVYLWDGQRWNFLTNVDPQANQASVTTMKLGTFSIMGDYDPPSVMDLLPSGYAEPDVRITAKVKDNGSGIDPKNIEARIDGQFVEVPGTALKDDELSLVLPEKLEQGHYSLQVTVRDNVGNQTEATSRFQVEGELTLKNVFCYPNPFQPARGVHFAYTLTESVNNVTIRIFGMDGKLVRKIDGTTSIGENLVPWDGRDEAGELVLSSVYISHIEAEGSRETVVETIKIAGWE